MVAKVKVGAEVRVKLSDVLYGRVVGQRAEGDHEQRGHHAHTRAARRDGVGNAERLVWVRTVREVVTHLKCVDDDARTCQ